MRTSELVLLHFNDVVVAPRSTFIGPYTIFSGDVFSPSVEASILRGSHMIQLLRELKVDLACYGNHDFDFGEQRLSELTADTHFPWLLSNAFRSSGGFELHPSFRHTGAEYHSHHLLAGAVKYHTVRLQGFKVGFFGLAGTDWPSNCRELPQCIIASPVDVSRACARHLRRVSKCDFVIALTHMRLAEDIDVSEALRTAPPSERVDLLLGGHDHELLRRYGGESSPRCRDPTIIDCAHAGLDGFVAPITMLPMAQGDIRIIKSGTDWQSLSCVRLIVSRTPEGVATLQSVAVEQIANMTLISLDPVCLAENERRVAQCLRHVNARIDELGADPLLHTDVDLEGTGTIIRSAETNLGNMLADMIRAYYNVEIALVNSGSIRCDKVIRATTSKSMQSGCDKPMTVRDLIEILPFDNPITVKRVTSDALLDALENSFSDAHTDGRFLQYGGLNIVADWNKPEGKRITEAWHCQDYDKPKARTRIHRGDERSYTVAMIAFIAQGFDGYACLKDQEIIVTEEGAVTDTQLLLRTLGYGTDNDHVQRGDGPDGDEACFERARELIVVRQDSFGLPVISPSIEGRITSKEGLILPK